jgi:hypothetical protein
MGGGEEDGGARGGGSDDSAPEEEKACDGGSDGDAPPHPDDLVLAGVDVAEQRRILRDIWVAAQAGRGGGSGSAATTTAATTATAADLPPQKRAKGTPAGPRQASLGAAFLMAGKGKPGPPK